MKNPLISVIIPTFNSAQNVKRLLESLSRSYYSHFEVLVVDSVDTTDNTRSVVYSYGLSMRVHYLKENTGMAQARAYGALRARGSILLHLDSDMTVAPTLLGELAKKLLHAHAAIIPERAVGQSYWSRIKALEKRMYQNERDIESIRAITARSYHHVGGHNQTMLFGEDKDFDIRCQQHGLKTARTRSMITHHEGAHNFSAIVRKKANYARSARVYSKEHPHAFSHQANPFHRYVLFFKKRKLAPRFIDYISLNVLKTAEYVASFIAYR